MTAKLVGTFFGGNRRTVRFLTGTSLLDGAVVAVGRPTFRLLSGAPTDGALVADAGALLSIDLMVAEPLSPIMCADTGRAALGAVSCMDTERGLAAAIVAIVACSFPFTRLLFVASLLRGIVEESDLLVVVFTFGGIFTLGAYVL